MKCIVQLAPSAFLASAAACSSLVQFILPSLPSVDKALFSWSEVSHQQQLVLPLTIRRHGIPLYC